MSCYSCDKKKCMACNYTEELQFPKHPSKPYKMIPTDGSMTNGDVIKTLFPFVTKHISHSENNIYIDSPIQATILAFDRHWWNAPYKAESEEV